MNVKEQDKRLAEARGMEKSGQLKSAYQAYLKAGSVQDAARLLATAGKPGDAGRLILSGLQVQPDEVARLDPGRRKLAYLAATYLAKSDKKDIAVELFSALGERSRAADILERAGDFIGAQRMRDGQSTMGKTAHPGSPKKAAIGGAAISRSTAQRLEREGQNELAAQTYYQLKQYGDSARVYMSLGRIAEAANIYAEGGMPYEAAVCYLKVGDTGKGLDNLIRVPRGDQRYRAAALQAVRVAIELNALSFQLEHFLSDFVTTGPAEEREFEAFYLLSRLYEQHNLLENAKEALKKILKKNPGYKDAAARLQYVEQQSKGSAAVYERIRDQEASFRGERRVGAPAAKPESMPGLPPLPEIPDLPPPPKITGLNISPDGALQAAPPPVQSGIAVDATMSMPGPGAPVTPAAAGGVANATPASLELPPTEPPGAPTEQDKGFVVGNTIAQRYLLDSELGRGGMAVVFKAHDLELDEDIALKVFLQQVLDPQMQEESLGRFKQELKLSRQLTHQNIIRLYDIGMHYGHRYISMELLQGDVLEDLLDQPMDFARGLAYLVQACAGLQAAHDKGVVHRDIKPDNLFVTRDEMLKVMDFGIAKNTHTRGLTIEGMTAGTPEYMAPEQISDFSNVTGAVDQYALGMIAYRMFTGALAFEHEELTPLLVMHLHQQPKPPRELNPRIPETLERIILKLIAKKPAERFSSCRELASHLQQLRTTFRRS